MIHFPHATLLPQFACGSAFQKGKNGLPDQIEVQGNYKYELPEFIISKFGVAPTTCLLPTTCCLLPATRYLPFANLLLAICYLMRVACP